MSNIRFGLAKKYIHERHYEKAREILETMQENPTAQKWLTRLDEIDPPFTGDSSDKAKRMSSSQARRFALNKAVRRAQTVRRIAGIILSLIGVGIMVFMLIIQPFLQRIEVPYASSNGFGMPMTYGTMYFEPLLEAHCVTGLILGIGLALVCTGLYQIWDSGREPDHF